MYYKKVVLSYKAPLSVKETLEGLGIEVIPTTKHKNISREIMDHADMQLTKVSGDLFVCAPEVYDYYKAYLGEKLICGEKALKCNYPYDIAYNVARVGKYAFHNTKYTDINVLSSLEKENVKMINVNQGYTKCNMCVAGENVITSDDGIYISCIENNVPALKISQGSILLDGYDYGFIGGASGMIGDDTLFFAGDITLHPDFESMQSFLKSAGVKTLYVPGTPLTDVGTVIGI